MTPYIIAANSATHWLRTDRTRKGNLVQQALRARPAEVRRSGVLTARREEGSVSGEGAHMENFFYAFHSTFCPRKKTKSGMDLTIFFDFKEVWVPPPLPSYTSCKKERSLLSIGIQGLTRSEQGWVQTAYFITKAFEKIYVTFKYEYECFTSTHVSFYSPAPTWIGSYSKEDSHINTESKGQF